MTVTYLISYDLNKAKNYSALYDRLNDIGAKRMMDSTWIVKRYNASAPAIHDYLKIVMDGDDSLVVVGIDGYAYSGVLSGTNEYLKAA